MKKIIQIILVTILLISCTKSEETNEWTGNVKVKFTNNTGFVIKNLMISDRALGTLNNKQTTKYIPFESFGFDTGMPDENCEGIINGNKIESINQFYWCGTQKERVEKGTYEMEITLVDSSDKKYFKLTVKVK